MKKMNLALLLALAFSMESAFADSPKAAYICSGPEGRTLTVNVMQDLTINTVGDPEGHYSADSMASQLAGRIQYSGTAGTSPMGLARSSTLIITESLQKGETSGGVTVDGTPFSCTLNSTIQTASSSCIDLHGSYDGSDSLSREVFTLTVQQNGCSSATISRTDQPKAHILTAGTDAVGRVVTFSGTTVTQVDNAGDVDSYSLDKDGNLVNTFSSGGQVIRTIVYPKQR